MPVPFTYPLYLDNLLYAHWLRTWCKFCSFECTLIYTAHRDTRFPVLHMQDAEPLRRLRLLKQPTVAVHGGCLRWRFMVVVSTPGRGRVDHRRYVVRVARHNDEANTFIAQAILHNAFAILVGAQQATHPSKHVRLVSYAFAIVPLCAYQIQLYFSHLPPEVFCGKTFCALSMFLWTGALLLDSTAQTLETRGPAQLK